MLPLLLLVGAAVVGLAWAVVVVMVVATGRLWVVVGVLLLAVPALFWGLMLLLLLLVAFLAFCQSTAQSGCSQGLASCQWRLHRAGGPLQGDEAPEGGGGGEADSLRVCLLSALSRSC